MEIRRITQHTYDTKLNLFLKRLKVTLSLSDSELSDHMKMSLRELKNVLDGHVELDIMKLCSLARVYNFNLDALFDDKIDFETLRQQHHGHSDFLPAKYTLGAFSKKRLIQTILRYVELNYGWQMRENILTYFQMSSISYSHPDEKINVYLFEEVLRYLLKLKLTSQDIRNIGQLSILSTTGTSFEKELSVCKSPQELFEKYFDQLINFIEHNNSYVITKSFGDYCEVESREINDNLDIFKVSNIGGPLRCIYRAGALEATTQYIGFPSAEVHETSCVHRGDNVCTFKIQYVYPVKKPTNVAAH